MDKMAVEDSLYHYNVHPYVITRQIDLNRNYILRRVCPKSNVFQAQTIAGNVGNHQFCALSTHPLILSGNSFPHQLFFRHTLDSCIVYIRNVLFLGECKIAKQRDGECAQCTSYADIEKKYFVQEEPICGHHLYLNCSGIVCTTYVFLSYWHTGHVNRYDTYFASSISDIIHRTENAGKDKIYGMLIGNYALGDELGYLATRYDVKEQHSGPQLRISYLKVSIPLWTETQTGRQTKRVKTETSDAFRLHIAKVRNYLETNDIKSFGWNIHDS